VSTRVRDNRLKFETAHIVELEGSTHDFKLLLEDAIIPVAYGHPFDRNKTWYVARNFRR
jgi:hypothetical protein